MKCICMQILQLKKRNPNRNSCPRNIQTLNIFDKKLVMGWIRLWHLFVYVRQSAVYKINWTATQKKK